MRMPTCVFDGYGANGIGEKKHFFRLVLSNAKHTSVTIESLNSMNYSFLMIFETIYYPSYALS